MSASIAAISYRLRILYGVVLLLITLMYTDAAYLAVISALEFWTSEIWQTELYQLLFLFHIFGGLLLSGCMGGFIVWHALRSWQIPNVTARRLGLIMSGVTAVITVTGILLIRIVGFLELTHPLSRQLVYWLHVIAPILAIWLFWLHRLAGRPINWKSGRMRLASGVIVLLCLLVYQFRELQTHQTPASIASAGQTTDAATMQNKNFASRLTGDQFFPALTRTSSGQFIKPERLMNDAFCQECHPDVHARWSDSVHRFSSFNNPAYLASVEQTKRALLSREGNSDAVQWCAGCHDPVPLLSGLLQKPDYDTNNDPTASAGITCTVCHSVTAIGSTRGNGDYIYAEPAQYPFAESKSPVLQWINRQMIKAKPALHKQTYLKPLHKSAEFCSTCHKVHLPKALNDYKDFLRGQNHYDSFLLSGVSGHGAFSFYYPEVAQENCNQCHMPARTSHDIAAQPIGINGELAVHDHLFPAANTAIPWLNKSDNVVSEQQNYLKDTVSVDLFGLRKGGRIDGELMAPLGDRYAEIIAGETYLLEIVVRTLKLGHHFTQGTVDSNQVWLRVRLNLPGDVSFHSGEIGTNGRVDPESHFLNAYVIDRSGNRIAKRNAQDIFVKVYDHQIPPGAGQTVHYQFTVPENIEGSLQISAEVLYRKFDSEYMQFVAEHARQTGQPLRDDPGEGIYPNRLPITTLAQNQVSLVVVTEMTPPHDRPSNQLSSAQIAQQPSVQTQTPEWQRWNDYGIGLFLKDKAELRQAEQAFAQVEKLGYATGAVNLARCYFREGRLDEASAALQRAGKNNIHPTQPWTINYLVGLVNTQQGDLVAAERAFRSILETVSPETKNRGFDFSRDYRVRNQLALTLYNQAQQIRTKEKSTEKQRLLQSAKTEFLKVLHEDSENLTAHYNLTQIARALADDESASLHGKLSERYQPDYNAMDQAVRMAREKSPLANAAAEPVTIYQLKVQPE